MRSMLVAGASLALVLAGTETALRDSPPPPAEIPVPVVVINYAYNIDRLLEIADSGRAAPNIEAFKIPARIGAYRAVWEHRGPAALQQMQQLTDLRFATPALEVSVINRGGVPFARPLIIPFTDEPKPAVHFSASLTHELVHRLLNDTFGDDGSRPDRLAIVYASVVPGADVIVASHVVTFAVMQCMYGSGPLADSEILRIERERSAWGEPDNAYTRAWGIVDERGCGPILTEFRRASAVQLQ